MTLHAPLAAILLLTAASLHAQTRAHEHGVLKVAVAIEGATLAIDVEMPLDNLVGFERAPRTDAERKFAADALARMRDGADLFKPNAEARCKPARTAVEAPVLEPGAKSASASEHADLHATYVFECAQAAQLASLDVSVFDAFKRVKQIEIQVAGPKGQRKVVLRPPARQVQLAK
jgi:hypothetical protein